MSTPSIRSYKFHSWVVLHTKSRREKKIAAVCRNKYIKCFLPLRKSISVIRGKRHEFHVPIFPGYVFCCINDAKKSILLRTGHLAKIIQVRNQETLLKELQNIKKAIDSKAVLKRVYYLQKGQKVKIVRGSFKGLFGLYQQHGKKGRLVLNVNFIGESAAMEVDESWVEPV